MFPIFPITIIEGRKVPLITGWQDLATTDADQRQRWIDYFGERIRLWGVPTGPKSGLLVLDADAKHGGVERAAALQLPPTAWQQTMSGGMHFLYRYPNDGQHYGNRVGILKTHKNDETGLDIRGAGGYIAWYGADLTVPIADAPAWLLEEARKQEVIATGPSIGVAPSIAEAVILEALEAIRQAPVGEANVTLNEQSFKVGQLVAAGAVSRESAYTQLMQAAAERGKSVRESHATITSGLDGGIKKPLTSPFSAAEPVPPPTVLPMLQPSRWTPEKMTRSGLQDTSKLRKPQLYRGWSTEDLHITTADGGTGKTTLELFESVCMALGERFLGFDCIQRGRTLYITGEDTGDKLQAMVGAIVRQMGLFNDPHNQENNDKIQCIIDSIMIKKDAGMQVVIRDKQGFYHPNPDAMMKVMEAVEDFQPKKIVFDPIASFWGSEAALNDMSRAVIKFMSELQERSGAQILMINHMGKQSSNIKDMSQFAGRGGTSLPSHSRVSRTLRPVYEEEYRELTGKDLPDGENCMMCMVNKFSDGSPLLNKPFLILRKGFLFYKEDLSEKKQIEAERQLSDVERVLGFIKDERSNGKYPTEQIVLGHFMTVADKLSKDRIKRALHMLNYQGHMGEKIKPINNPDETVGGKVFVLLDAEGQEMT